MVKFFEAPSQKNTSRFYDDLMNGTVERGILGRDNRFNSDKILGKESIRKYYLDVIRPYIKTDDCVLDFGCGPGTFMLPIASMCKRVVGVDISRRFVDSCYRLLSKNDVSNALVMQTESNVLPFANNSFDVLMLVDVIHHLDARDRILKEVLRVLKPGGRIIAYEPNKLNPVIALMHLIDPNEWGLLQLGTPQKYRSIMAHNNIRVEKISYNGIVIGPQSLLFDRVASILNKPFLLPFVGWLNPKIFVTGVKYS